VCYNLLYELGASPQLESWNNGVLEYWVLASGLQSLRLRVVIVEIFYWENEVEKASNRLDVSY
jgi:hypothetical protein